MWSYWNLSSVLDTPVQGITVKFEQTFGGSTAQTVKARETYVAWKDGRDIEEYEAKRI